MESCRLDDRAVISLSGPEARGFLQNLVTNDVEKLSPGTGLYAALLSPQGKIAFDFFLVEGDGAILLDVAAAAREALLRKLRMYRLRARIEIEARDQLGVYAALAGHPDNRPTPYAARAVTFADPRTVGLPARSIGAVQEMPAGVTGPAPYHALRLALGVPEAGDFGFEKIFALDGGLDELIIQFGPRRRGLRGLPNVGVETLPKLDHALFTRAARDAAMHDAYRWFVEHFVAPEAGEGVTSDDRLAEGFRTAIGMHAESALLGQGADGS